MRICRPFGSVDLDHKAVRRVSCRVGSNHVSDLFVRALTAGPLALTNALLTNATAP